MVWLKISATERNLENHQKLPNFAGLLWPSHLTKIWSWGTNGKRISISFIWYLVMQNISIILATLTTFTTRGQTENEKMGSDMSISSEVPGSVFAFRIDSRQIRNSGWQSKRPVIRGLWSGVTLRQIKIKFCSPIRVRKSLKTKENIPTPLEASQEGEKGGFLEGFSKMPT